MAGRKPIYNTRDLKVGEKIELFGKAKKFKDQYLYNFNKQNERKFVLISEDSKVFVQRAA